MAIDSSLVVYHSRSSGKKNEIKTVQSMLKLLDTKDACITLDAMHCQTETVATIREQKAHYLIQVKNAIRDLTPYLCWQEVAGSFKTTWHNVFTAVEQMVEYGLAHRDSFCLRCISGSAIFSFCVSSNLGGDEDS